MMMHKEYIEREAAIIGLAASSLMPHQIDDAAEALRLVPAADVVAVVRCGECIRKNICWIVSADDNWYCADGESRNGGQEDD